MVRLLRKTVVPLYAQLLAIRANSGSCLLAELVTLCSRLCEPAKTNQVALFMPGEVRRGRLLRSKLMGAVSVESRARGLYMRGRMPDMLEWGT